MNLMELPPKIEKEIDVLRDALIDAGLKDIIVPKLGTAAYDRLWSVAKEYSKEVHMQMVGREIDLSESQSHRRKLHNQLCIMLLGIDHAATTKRNSDDIKRIANFAHLVSDREQYVDLSV